MRSLDRYIIREFLRIFFVTLLAVVVLYLIVDFFERVNMIMKHDASLRNSLLFFLYKIPMILTQTTPIVVLLTTVISLGSLNRRNEVTAIRASGIPDWNIFRPILGSGLLLSVFMLFFSETVLPYSNAKMEYVKNVEIQNRSLGIFRSTEIWYRDGNGIFHIERISRDRTFLQGVHIWFLSPEFRVEKRVDAPEVRWEKDRWYAPALITRTRTGGFSSPFRTTIEESVSPPIPQVPEDFSLVIKNPDEMSFLELRNYSKRLQSEGQETQQYRTSLHMKISIPFLSLIVAFLGTPLGLRIGRRGGIFLGILLSTIIGFAFWTVLGLGFSLGSSGVLPPLISAWISHVVFAAAGLLLLLRKAT